MALNKNQFKTLFELNVYTPFAYLVGFTYLPFHSTFDQTCFTEIYSVHFTTNLFISIVVSQTPLKIAASPEKLLSFLQKHFTNYLCIDLSFSSFTRSKIFYTKHSPRIASLGQNNRFHQFFYYEYVPSCYYAQGMIITIIYIVYTYTIKFPVDLVFETIAYSCTSWTIRRLVSIPSKIGKKLLLRNNHNYYYRPVMSHGLKKWKIVLRNIFQIRNVTLTCFFLLIFPNKNLTASFTGIAYKYKPRI